MGRRDRRQGCRGNEAVTNDVAMLDSAEIDDDTAAAIAQVAQTRDGIKIKFRDKLGALEKISKSSSTAMSTPLSICVHNVIDRR